jgi:hypothetical protein
MRPTHLRLICFEKERAMRMLTKFGTVAALFLAILFAAPGRAQVRNSGASPISLNAVLPDSITLTLSGHAVNFTLAAGRASNPGSTGITATTFWVMKPSVNSLKLYAFFNSSTAALSDGAGHNIPSADFQISDNGGAFAALTNTVAFGGANAGLQVSSVPIRGFNKTGTKSDLMTFNINLAPLPNLAAGVYTGSLTIQAQAF